MDEQTGGSAGGAPATAASPAGLVPGWRSLSGWMRAGILLFLFSVCGCIPAAVWSPDGSRIAVMSGPDVYLFDVRKGEFRRLTRGEVKKREAFGAAWSPDGKRLAYFLAEGDRKTVSLRSLELARRKETLLVSRVPVPWDAEEDGDLGSLRHQCLAAWSPDGSALIYQCKEGEQDYLSLVGAAGGQSRRLSPGPRSVSHAAWSPDGRRVVYVAALDGSGEKEEDAEEEDERYVLESVAIHVGAAGPPREFWRPPAGLRIAAAPCWSADGRSLGIFLEPSEESDDSDPCQAWILSADGAESRKLVEVPGEAWSAAFSLDLRSIVFLEEFGEAERRRVVLLPAPDYRPRVLYEPREGKSGLMAPRFSPDGRRAAVVETQEDEPDVLLICPTDGSPARRFIVPRPPVEGGV